MPEESILIDEFNDLQETKKQIDNKLERLKEAIIQFSIKNNKKVLTGTSKNCSIKEYAKIIFPEDKTKLIELIKSKGLYEQLSSINYLKLSPKIVKREIDSEIINLTRIEKAFRVILIDKNRFIIGV